MAKIAEYNAPVEKLRPSDAGYSASETAARQIRVSYNEAGTADREVGTLANDLARTIAQEQREAGASRVLGLHGSGGGGRVGVTKNYFGNQGAGRSADDGMSRLSGLAASAVPPPAVPTPDNVFATYAQGDAMYSNTAIGQPGYKSPNPTESYDQQLKEEKAARVAAGTDTDGIQPYQKDMDLAHTQAGYRAQGIQGAPGEDEKILIPTYDKDNNPTGLTRMVAPDDPAAIQWYKYQQMSPSQRALLDPGAMGGSPAPSEAPVTASPDGPPPDATTTAQPAAPTTDETEEQYKASVLGGGG